MSQKNTKIEIISESAAQTEELASFIGKTLREGDVLALSGELGSGKTCFASGLARGFGSKRPIPDYVSDFYFD